MKTSAKDTLLAIANAIDLTSSIVADIAGEDIGNSLDGKILTGEDLKSIVGMNVQGHFSKYVRVGA